MNSFRKARKNMVDCQIHTNGVIIPEILTAFEEIPRERFVPQKYAAMACNDEDVHLGHGRYLLEPAVHARLIQALELTPECVVLDIGSATGYGPAILSTLVTTVIALEPEESFINQAAKLWDENDLRNIVSFKGALEEGNPDHAPYDSIIIEGAVAAVPETILNQLAPNGRLVCVIKKPGHIVGQACLFRKTMNGQCSSHPLFDAATPYLAGFEPKAVFQF